MILSIPLQPLQESLLLATAQAKGVGADVVVHEVLDRFLADQTEAPTIAPKRAVEAVPIWEFILQNMSDVPDGELSGLPEDGAARVDNYLYGSGGRSKQ